VAAFGLSPALIVVAGLPVRHTCQVIPRLDLPGQEPAPQRRVGDDADPQLTARRDQIFLYHRS
jgi:hypothetical protein